MDAVPGALYSTIIQRKVVPPSPHAQLVSRPRVERLLARLLETHEAVIVSASAGSGKTVAAMSALRRLGRPLAWLNVDRTDAAPGRLITYLEAALARARPSIGDVATRSLHMGIPHAEAAGLLMEAVEDEPLVLVLDELERLGDSPDAWAVIEAVLRYAPRTMCTVLLSRRDIPSNLCALPPTARIAAVGDEDLAFTVSEAEAALVRHHGSGINPASAVEATGGWVTGVLFEAWRAKDHIVGAGGEADALHGYLSSHILGELTEEQRNLLITTSLLTDVTPESAKSMGVCDASRIMRELQSAHIPASWGRESLTMHCHSRFREYLQSRLELRGDDEVRNLYIAHGCLLADEGLWEEATEELLKVGALAEAMTTAERAILPIIDRLDLHVADRWLDALSSLARPSTSPLTAAELMLSIGREDFHRASQVIEALESDQERDRLASISGRTAAMMGWYYMHAGKVQDLNDILKVAKEGPDIEAVRYARWIVTNPADDDEPVPVELHGTPTDALIFITELILGRAQKIIDATGSAWVDFVLAPWRIAALRATGHTQRALEAYETAVASNSSSVILDVYIGPDVLIDAHETDRAREAIRRGREIARKSGSIGYQVYSILAEAKLQLRLAGDMQAAVTLLESAEKKLEGREIRHLSEVIDMWYGLAILMDNGDTGEALRRLRRAVTAMRDGHRLLDLPTAAVYLAEAEWRAGNQHAADTAADLALDAARRNESNHVLLQALADFPVVVSRRVDAEPRSNSEWHELGRALLAQGVEVQSRIGTVAHIKEFGLPIIFVNGQEVTPRINKSIELMAFLASCHGWRAQREEILEALFAGRATKSTQTYFRQAVHHLRSVLPDRSDLATVGNVLRFREGVVVQSDAANFEARLSEVSRMRGMDRLDGTLDALSIVERGEYMPQVDSVWAADRRLRLEELATSARYEAAELAFSCERIDEAQELCDIVVRDNPYLEAAWRLQMKLASVLGDEAGVIKAYLNCVQALAQIGTKPTVTTKNLLERLRR